MTANNKVEKQELLNISKLAFRFDLDRATVRSRLNGAGIEPVEEKAKEKLYLLDARLERALQPDEDDLLDAAKLRKTTAEADLKEIEVQKKNGELIPAADCVEAVTRLFNAMQKKCVVQTPKKLAKKLAKAKNETEIAMILTTEYEHIFQELRENHQKFLT